MVRCLDGNAMYMTQYFLVSLSRYIGLQHVPAVSEHYPHHCCSVVWSAVGMAQNYNIFKKG